jgi:hypothetical protein
MRRHLMARILPLVWILILSGQAFLPSRASCQLRDVEWKEAVTLGSQLGSVTHEGADPARPEPQNWIVGANGYALSGSVTFDVGPPNTRTHIEGDNQSTYSDMAGQAVSTIVFEFVVRETSPPPVAVSQVPVTAVLRGGASAGGDAVLYANGFASADLSTPRGSIGFWSTEVDNGSGPVSKEFNETVRYELSPHVIVTGTLTARSRMATDIRVTLTAASASAWVDPVIAIADETIPGTALSYRDHYQIETAPGYWALDTVPVRTTTWGKIKRLYMH